MLKETTKSLGKFKRNW